MLPWRWVLFVIMMWLRHELLQTPSWLHSLSIGKESRTDTRLTIKLLAVDQLWISLSDAPSVSSLSKFIQTSPALKQNLIPRSKKVQQSHKYRWHYKPVERLGNSRTEMWEEVTNERKETNDIFYSVSPGAPDYHCVPSSINDWGTIFISSIHHVAKI